MHFYTLINTINSVKKYLNSWKPTDIFHDGKKGYLDYNKPYTSFYGESYGEYYDDYTFTSLGKWFDDAPLIMHVFKLFYYIPAYSAWFITNILWLIIAICLPKCVKDSL